MIVTGVQAVGSKGVNSVQVAAVDPKEVARVGSTTDNDRHHGVRSKAGEPQPVVFPRDGAALDKRPAALRREHAVQMYAAYGGDRSDKNRDGRPDT